MVYCMQYYVFALRQINRQRNRDQRICFRTYDCSYPGSLEIRWNEWTSGKLPAVSIPGLKELPVIGTLFTEQSPYLFITAGTVLGVLVFMYRTKAGLRLRAIGDHPQAAQTVGINVSLHRYVAVTFCGMLCGLAGGYLSIVQSNLFVKEMVGRPGIHGIGRNEFSVDGILLGLCVQALYLHLHRH